MAGAVSGEVIGDVCWVTLRVPLYCGDCGLPPDWVDKLETKMLNADQRMGLSRLTLGLEKEQERIADGAPKPKPVYLHAHSARWILEQLAAAFQKTVGA